MIALAEIVGLVVLASLTLYALGAGADFGAEAVEVFADDAVEREAGEERGGDLAVADGGGEDEHAREESLLIVVGGGHPETSRSDESFT